MILKVKVALRRPSCRDQGTVSGNRRQGGQCGDGQISRIDRPAIYQQISREQGIVEKNCRKC